MDMPTSQSRDVGIPFCGDNQSLASRVPRQTVTA